MKPSSIPTGHGSYAVAETLSKRNRRAVARGARLRLRRVHHSRHGLLPVREQLFFGDLAHYTRSGDFILALFREAHDLNEYAFALGALAHYAADNLGHPIAINRTVPMVYPKLQKKYGPVVTYEDDPNAHLKTEFGFDVIEVARGQYASEAYHDFIGFNVAK